MWDLEESELDRSGQSGQSVYRQIADYVRTRIECGAFGAGERLPPIRRLAGQLGVSRDTIALSYEALARDGLVQSTVGRGTFVCTPEERPPRSREPAELALSPCIDRLLALETARPRFASAQGIVPLHSLIPDPAFYPVDEFRKAFNRVLARSGPDLFLYAAPQGHPELREAVAARLRDQDIDVTGEEIVLCHGASQGISLAVRLLAEAGDAVAVEVPTYHNVMASLVACGVEAVSVPMSEAGPDLASLDRVLSREDVKAFYTIPTFHNPLGSTTTLANRRGLLEIAARHGVAVIEDAFEMDLRFMGDAVPPLMALDDTGRVIHLSSFSKSLFPGIRAGAIAARGRAIDGLMALKHSSDLSDSMPLQAALAEFIAAGEYDRHLVRLRRELRLRRNALLDALDEYMPQGSVWTEPEGGYQCWLELPMDVDTRDMLADAARAGVLFAPGSQFLPDRGASRAMRLVIAQANCEEIRRGIEALGRVVAERQAAEPVALQSASVHL